jgi:predicted SnoaL-like aldol condensation-catalyzing enzyme
MTDSNKDAAINFLMLASSGKIREAYSTYVGAGFRHHNPYFEGSQETLMAGMEESQRKFPDKLLGVRLAVAEGDLVVLYSHVHMTPGDPGVAVVHIFRFEEGHIVELWDVGQVVPENTPNQFGMF